MKMHADKLWDYFLPNNAVTKLQKMMQTNASANTVGAAYADAANAFMSKNASIICNGSWMSSELKKVLKINGVMSLWEQI